MEEREAKEWAGVDSDVDAEPATADQSSKRRELETLCVQNSELRTLLADKRRVTQALASQVANMEVSNQVLHDSLARRETELAAQQDDYERAASGLATKMLDLQAREKLLLEKSANLKGSIERDVKLQLSQGAASVRVRELETETDLYLRLDALESKRMRVHHLEAEVARGRQELEMRRGQLREREALLACKTATLDAKLHATLKHDEAALIHGVWPFSGQQLATVVMWALLAISLCLIASRTDPVEVKSDSDL